MLFIANFYLFVVENTRRAARSPWNVNSVSTEQRSTNYLPEEEFSGASGSDASESGSESDVDVAFDPQLREDRMLGYHVVS